MRIAAYCRVSTDKEEQLHSLNHQKEFFTEYARRNGHELYRLYADEGISGTSLKKREEFKKLLRDAEFHLFDMVVVKDISRFARNTVDALQSIRKLKNLGINTLFLTANMDSMGDSEFVLTLFSAMAQEESNHLSKRVKWGKRINAEKGRVPQRIFGYDRIDKFTLEINPREAETVRKIFSLYSEQGLGCRTVSMVLNRDGDKTKFGGEWNPRGVRRVLVNPIYCGILINHKYEIEDFLTGKQVPIPKEEQFIHRRPAWAIVTPEVFQKTQEILESRRKTYDCAASTPSSRYSGRHTFSTLIKCAHCGRSFTRKIYTYANTRVYWRCVTNDQYTAEKCPNRVILDESILIQTLKNYISSLIADKKDFTARVLSAVEAQFPDSANPEWIRQALEAKQKKLLIKQERYQEMYASGLITMAALKDKLTAISEELKALDRVSPEIRNREEPALDLPQEITRFLDLETVTNSDMRQIIHRITVDQEGNVRVMVKNFEESETR